MSFTSHIMDNYIDNLNEIEQNTTKKYLNEIIKDNINKYYITYDDFENDLNTDMDFDNDIIFINNDLNEEIFETEHNNIVFIDDNSQKIKKIEDENKEMNEELDIENEKILNRNK